MSDILNIADFEDANTFISQINVPGEKPVDSGLNIKDFTTVDKFLQNKTKEPANTIEIYNRDIASRISKIKDLSAMILNNADKPDDEQAKLQVSGLISAVLKIPYTTVWNNFDTYTEALLNERLPPKTAAGVLAKSFKNGVIQVSAAQKAYQWLITNNSQALDNALELNKQIKPTLYKYDNLWRKILNATGNQLPMLMQGMKYALASAAGGAALGGPTGVGAVPGAIAGGTIGAFIGSSKMETGFTVLELFSLKDKNGNGIDPKIIKVLALAAGGLKGVIETVGMKEFLATVPGVSKVFDGVLTTAIRNVIEGGGIKNIVLRTAAKIGTRAGLETAVQATQEMVQELVDVVADKVGAELSGYDIPTETASQVVARVADVGVQTVMGTILPLLPGITGNVIFSEMGGKTKGYAQEVKKLSKEIPAEIPIETPVTAEITGDQAGDIIIKSKDKEISKANYKIENNKLKIYNMDTLKPKDAQLALSELMARNPDHKVELIGNTENLLRVTEDQNPVLNRINTKLDITVENLKSRIDEKTNIEQEIQTLEKSKEDAIKTNEDVSDYDIQINEYKTELKSVDSTINVLNAEGREFQRQKQFALNRISKSDIYTINGRSFDTLLKQTARSESIAELDLTNKIKTAYNEAGVQIKDKEIDAQVSLLKIYAHGRGMKYDEFLKKYPIRFNANNEALLEGHSAAIAWNDGKDIVIGLSKRSGFRDVLHEFMHLIVYATPEAELKPLLDYTKHRKWTSQAKEDAVGIMEQYISNPKDTPTVLRKVLEKVLDSLKYIYSVFAGKKQLSPEIKETIGNILYGANKKEAVYAARAKEGVLFSPNLEHTDDEYRYILQETDEYVPDEALQRLAAKGMKLAQEELTRRKQYRQAEDVYRRSFPKLMKEAEQYDSYEDFVTYVETFYDDKELAKYKELGHYQDKDFALYDAWRASHISSIEEGNKIWAEHLTDEYLGNLLVEIKKRYKEAANMGMHGKLLSSAITKTKGYADLKTFLTNNAAKYRELLSRFLNDAKEMSFIVREKGIDDYRERLGYVEEKMKPNLDRTRSEVINDLSKLRKTLSKEDYIKIVTGKYDEDYIDTLLRHTEREFKRGEKERGKLISELNTRKDKYNRLSNIYTSDMKDVNDMKKEIKNLSKDKEKNRDKISKLQERLDKKQIKLDETNTKLKAVREAFRSAKKEYKLAMKEKNRVQKARDAAKKARIYRKNLLKIFFKQPARNAHFDYKEQIRAMQNQFSRTKSKRYTKAWENSNAFFKTHPEVEKIMSDKTIKDLSKTPVNLITTEQLETMVAQVEHLNTLGKLKRKLQEIARKRAIAHKITILKQTIIEGNPVLSEKELTDLTKWAKDENKWGIFKNITLRPERLVDALEGGKEFSGVAHDMLIDQVRDLQSKEITARDNRLQAMREIRKKLDISIKDLSKTIEIGKYKMTKDLAQRIWGMWHNKRQREALQGAYGMDEAFFKELDSRLEDKYKKLAEAITKDYADIFPSMDEAHVLLTNKRAIGEDWYFPMRRLDHEYTENPESLSKEVTQVYGAGRAKVFDGMMNNRLNIKAEYQTKIQLEGAYQQYLQEVGIQEHYIHFANEVRELKAIMRNTEIKNLIKAKSTSLYTVLLKYIDRVANPRIVWSPTNGSRIVRFFRNHIAIAFLSYNFSVMLKQLPSMLFYMSKASFPHMVSALWQTATNWKEVRGMIEAEDPLMRERSIMRDIEELRVLKHKGITKLITKIGLEGMKGIMMADKLATTAGWLAVYQSQVGRVGHEEAVRIARDLTLRTQPSFSASEIADVYANEGMAFFVQFTNQLNQIWNMSIYDIPQAFKHGAIKEGMVMSSAIVLSGMMIWAISKGRLPQDKKDWLDMSSNTMLNMVPLIGTFTARAKQGYTPELAVFKPVEGIGATIQGMQKIINGEEISDAQRRSIISSFLEGLAISTGMPYTAGKRLYQAGKVVSEGNPLEALEALAFGLRRHK